MSAAELNFENPDAGQPGWLALTQGVFNSQAARWDSADCAGGLRWQIFTWNNGYTYKNTPSNGGLFNLASRLGAYTGNQTYFQWADKAWDWLEHVGLIGENYDIYDGTSIDDNCTSLDHTLWTYTAGMMLNGAAVMWNATTSDASASEVSADTWKARTQGIWNATVRNCFHGTNNMIMQEICEPTNNCNTDQQSFKAYLSRFMASSAKVAPWLWDDVRPYIEASAVAAGLQCSGGADGNTCGLKWVDNSTYDGSAGVGQQMGALEILGALLVKQAASPVSSSSGGTSQGDASAGTGESLSSSSSAQTHHITQESRRTPALTCHFIFPGGDKDAAAPARAITGADRAGAGILTALVCVGLLGGSL